MNILSINKMPFSLRKAPGKMLYWVVGEDGKHFSKLPIPKVDAKAQLRALYANVNVGSGSAFRDAYNGTETLSSLTGGAGGGVPAMDLLRMCEETYAIYKGKKPQAVGEWKVLESTPYLLLYSDGEDYVLAVRGSKEFQDVMAWFPCVLGWVNWTNRYNQDLPVAKQWKKKFPGSWFGTGHSLGGAIVDNLMAEGLIQSSMTFNPAVETKFVGNRNRRVYFQGDPVLSTLGTRDPHKVIVSDPEPQWAEILFGSALVKAIANGEIERVVAEVARGDFSNVKVDSLFFEKEVKRLSDSALSFYDFLKRHSLASFASVGLGDDVKLGGALRTRDAGAAGGITVYDDVTGRVVETFETQEEADEYIANHSTPPRRKQQGHRARHEGDDAPGPIAVPKHIRRQHHPEDLARYAELNRRIMDEYKQAERAEIRRLLAIPNRTEEEDEELSRLLEDAETDSEAEAEEEPPRKKPKTGKGAVISRVWRNEVSEADIRLSRWVVRFASAVVAGTTLGLLIRDWNQLNAGERAGLLTMAWVGPVLSEIIGRVSSVPRAVIAPEEVAEVRLEMDNNPLFQIPPRSQVPISIPSGTVNLITLEPFTNGEHIVRFMDGGEPSSNNIMTRTDAEAYMLTRPARRWLTPARTTFTRMEAGRVRTLVGGSRLEREIAAAMARLENDPVYLAALRERFAREAADAEAERQRRLEERRQAILIPRLREAEERRQRAEQAKSSTTHRVPVFRDPRVKTTSARHRHGRGVELEGDGYSDLALVAMKGIENVRAELQEEINELIEEYNFNLPSEAEWRRMSHEQHVEVRAVLKQIKKNIEKVKKAARKAEGELNPDPQMLVPGRPTKPRPGPSPLGRGSPPDVEALADLLGGGGEHMPFPYSSPNLSKEDKAKERAKHYRDVERELRRMGTKSYERLEGERKDVEKATPEKKLLTLSRQLFEVKELPPAELGKNVAARGVKPVKPKKVLTGDRKPYVGKKMKEAFAAAHGDNRNLFNQVKRLYKAGGVTWEEAMASVKK